MEVEKLNQNPFQFFSQWFEEYKKTGPREPTAMMLATASRAGVPSVRTVLLKSFDEKGFIFFTNYSSHKSAELIENPHAQLLFYWESLGRQVRVAGRVEKVSARESDEYFASRPYLSQIGAWASDQSQKIPNRQWLVDRVKEFSDRYPEGAPVPRPPHWGGFRIVPTSFEFWQGQENRLHDRAFYEWVGSTWQISRLSP